MRKIILHSVFLFSIFLTTVGLALADERMFVVDPQGKVHELSAQSKKLLGFGGATGLGWKEVDPAKLHGSQWAPTETARVTPSNTVEIDLQGSGSFADSGLRAPPAGITYKSAKLDDSGNLVVALGGNGKGFNYKVPSMPGPILANKMEWQPSPFPTEIADFEMIPGSNNFVIVGKDGSAYVIDPAAPGKRSFDWTEIPNVKGADQVAIVDGKMLVWGSNLPLSEIADPTGRPSISALPMPKGVQAGDQIFTSRQSLTALQTVASNKQAAVASQATAAAAASAQPNPPPAAQSAPAPKPAKPGAKQLTIAEIADTAKKPQAAKEAAAVLVGLTENNLFDEAVEVNNTTGHFPDYWGRVKEKNQVIDVLTKGQKQHLLVTGPAGAGKTTIMKALQDSFVKGDIKIRNEPPPIFLELPITSVTNPSDPSIVKKTVASAVEFSKLTGRRVVLFVDEGHVATKMTQNALKSFLTEATRPADGAPKVHVAFATTSAESQEFMSDTAFSRRFSGLHVEPFNREDTIKLIRQTLLPRWKKDHVKDGWSIADITDEALEYAYRFRRTEQQFSETGAQEMLEATIVAKMNRETDALRNNGKVPNKPVTIDVEDVREYIADKFGKDLMPGDPNFKAKFEEKWKKFEESYVGNDGMKAELKKILRSHFGQPNQKNMTAIAAFGPPGGGKSFGAEKIAEVFFKGAILETNGAELKNGGLELNKLIGSPPGTKDNEHRGELTRMLREHPEGFVWKIEEGDYMHQDVVDLKTNIITSKKFKDGMGKEWDASNIMIWENSNIGQDLMIPQGAANKMDWTQYELRRKGITQKALVDGKEVERVRPDIMEGVFRNYIDKIVMGSNPGQDTSVVEQEAAKQIRRYAPLYVLPPTKEELADAARVAVKKYIKDMKLEHGVTFEIPDETIMSAVDLDQYNFKTGHGYVNKQLERRLFDPLLDKLSERGAKIHVGMEDTTIVIDGEEAPSKNLILTSGGRTEKISLGGTDTKEKNPWGTNKAMMNRIDDFSRTMGKYVKGNTPIIEDMGQALKEKAVDWKANTTFTFLGTSGNGKTEMAKGLAKSLYDTEDALFTITGVDHPWDLGDYFRPPTGIQGGTKETQFEQWFKSRKNAGGGVILFDELLSELGSKGSKSVDGQKGGKLAVLQELYEFLAERRLKIAGAYHDASAFIPVITGNSLQELFSGLDDNPETDDLVKKITAQLTRSRVVSELENVGLDAPKIARLGRIYVLGPQPKNIQLEVGQMKLTNAIKSLQKEHGKPLEILIDDKAVPTVVDRLSTIKLGMREVETGFRTLTFQPLKTLMADFKKAGVPVSKIEMKLVNMKGAPEEKATQWFVNGQEVVQQATSNGEGRARKISWVFKDKMADGAVDLTPTTKMLNSVEKTKVSPELLKQINEHELYGHWMVEALINQKNGADFVSTIPGPGYLGYVRPKMQEMEDVQNLTTMLKRISELEAGHRANHYFGSFSPGGGNDGSVRDAAKPSNDDLGKINKYYRMLINNNMLPGVRENSTEAEKLAIIQILEKTVANSTDELIDFGVKSGKFKDLFDTLQEKRYLKREQLEDYLKKIEFEKMGYHGPDSLFLEKFAAGFLETMDEYNKRLQSISKDQDPRAYAMAEKEANRVKEMAGGVLGRLFKEAETRSAGNPKALAEIAEIKAAAIEGVKNPQSRQKGPMKINCPKAYENLFDF